MDELTNGQGTLNIDSIVMMTAKSMVETTSAQNHKQHQRQLTKGLIYHYSILLYDYNYIRTLKISPFSRLAYTTISQMINLARHSALQDYLLHS